MSEPNNTSTGLRENVAATLSYLGWWVTGIIFFLLEQQNEFIKFHALQSIAVFGVITVAAWIVGFIPVIGDWISRIIWLIGIALWIVLMVKAYQGSKYKIPVAGDLAEKWAERRSTPK